MKAGFVFNRPEETEKWCEVCEECPAVQKARFVDADICASCAEGEPIPASEHSKDSDCTVDPETGECVECHVWHDDPCPDCGGRGFHKEDCPQMVEA